MRRTANILQLAGATAFAAAGFTINTTTGLVATAIALVATGYVVERS